MIKDAYGNTRFYGLYRGVVVDNNDPLGKGRLQLQVPQILAEATTNWAWPISGAQITSEPPAKGQGAWVMFEGGDPHYPVWVGTFGDRKSTALPVYIAPSSGLTNKHIVTTTIDGVPHIDLVATLLNLGKAIG